MTGTALEVWRGPDELRTLRHISVACFGTFRRRRAGKNRMYRVWREQVRRGGGRYGRAWQNRCCAACGSRWRLTIDHVIAVSRGGCDHLHNLQLLCFDCNQSKADLLPWEWAAMSAGNTRRENHGSTEVERPLHATRR